MLQLQGVGNALAGPIRPSKGKARASEADALPRPELSRDERGNDLCDELDQPKEVGNQGTAEDNDAHAPIDVIERFVLKHGSALVLGFRMTGCVKRHVTSFAPRPHPNQTLSPALLGAGFAQEIADAAAADAAGGDDPVIGDHAARAATAGDALRCSAHGDAFERGLGGSAA
ncbi:hypothetical protein DSM104635_00451 [Terricaulis silvestris]|uniref:Uncharacterized protein n=1 Tax=Terricaulis silvestris TaxID=2686094 RepID=A0A6I6MH14_9CAUL|nr:hypothetical protein DSM104635_00451 [Terricaulis silvestris]